MGTPVSDMLSGGQGGLTPEALEAIKQLNASGALAQPAEGPVAPAAPLTSPGQPTNQGGGILDMLSKWFSSLLPSTKSLAPQGPAPAPVSPEELARRRQQMAGAAAPLSNATGQ